MATRMKRMVMLAMFFGVALVPAICACRGNQSAAGEFREPNHQIMLGLYQITWSTAQQQAGLEAVDAHLDGPPAIVMFYRDLARPFPEALCRSLDEYGAVPMVSWELWHWGDRHGGPERLPMINDGDYDEYFRAWARDLREYGRPVFIRFGFEMNGDWFSWGGRDPDGFVAAWRRAHAIFVEESATNGIWVWSPNVKSIPEVEREPWNDMHNYYPGDDVVDWVAVDGYNWGRTRNSNGYRWLSFDELLGPILSDFDERYPDKWQMIGEFASVGSEDGNSGHGGSKADWIREAYAQIPGYPRLGAIVWFNLDKNREGEFDWSLLTHSEVVRAYNESVDRPWYSASYDEWIDRHRSLQHVLAEETPTWQATNPLGPAR